MKLIDLKAALLYTVLLIILSIAASCIKYDDPPIEGNNTPISLYSSCTDTLEDNVVFLWADPGGSPLNNLILYSPEPTIHGLDYNGNQFGSFEIILTDSVTQSRTYNLSYPVLEAGEAQIKHTRTSWFAAPEYFSTSGTLYVILEPDGRLVYEWCDVYFQTNASNPLKHTSSGRIVSR